MGIGTYTLFVVSGLQGIFGFSVMGTSHATFSFLTTIIYLFFQTLTVFFFIGTSTNIREYISARQQTPQTSELLSQARVVRSKVSGQIYLNILLFLTQAVLGGAIAASAVPRFLHGSMVIAAFLHFHYMLWREHLGFRDMTKIVIKMTNPR
jgi:hypothetical protein